MLRILITGVKSYIGTSFEKWLSQSKFIDMYQVDTVDMQTDAWRTKDFSGYDTIFHVAGIAHADIGKITEEQKNLYYKVNCDLAVETAEKAKKEGVKQFVYMSSIIVYGEGSSVSKKRVITRETKPSPSNFYGDSKWKAEQRLKLLTDENFHLAILRPPMIYGEGCKGNYQLLRKIALKLPIFPYFPNERSMLYIMNLCEFVRCVVERQESGIYFPQDSEYVNTAQMVKQIAARNGKPLYLWRGCNWLIYLVGHLPGKIGRMTNKAFGSLVYENTDVQDIGTEYRVYSLEEAIKRTERKSMKKGN